MAGDDEKLSNSLDQNTEKDISEADTMEKTQREVIFGVLRSNMDIHHARDIIQKNVPERQQDNVFHCIWFFSTTLPDVGEQLLKLVEQKDLEWYIDLAYKSIYAAIDVRMDKTYHDKWNTTTPWKQDIQEMIVDIQDKKSMVDTIKVQTWTYIRWNGPTVALWLLPTERIDIHEA